MIPTYKLVERLEAEEITKELEDAVLIEFGWTPPRTGGAEFGQHFWKSPEGITTANPPRPLRSLDDAVKFVPENTIWQTGTADGASIYAETMPSYFNRMFESLHMDPVIGLTICSIKANNYKEFQ